MRLVCALAFGRRNLMKISEIEDYELLASKLDIEKLRTEMAQLEARLGKVIMESERAQRFWIWGLYVVVILNHFWK
jgi:hypothetical protein